MSIIITKKKAYTNNNINELKTLLHSINPSFNTEKLDEISMLSFEINIPLETINNTNFEIEDKYINYNEGKDLDFLNDLIWIYLLSQENFVKRLNEFYSLYNQVALDDIIVLNFEDEIEFINLILKKTNSPTFEHYRDKFYDDFGIDIVEYYNKVLNPIIDIHNNKVFSFKMLKNTETTFYPYKNIYQKTHYDITTSKPTHRLIKRYTSYIEVSSFLNDSTLEKLIKNIKENMKLNISDLTGMFEDYHIEDEDQEEILEFNTSKAFASINQSHNKFKTAMIIYEIMKFHNIIENLDINKGIRLFNFYLLKKYYNQIEITETDPNSKKPKDKSKLKSANLKFSLNSISDTNIINDGVELTLSKEVPLLLLIENADTTKNIKIIVKLFIQEFC